MKQSNSSDKVLRPSRPVRFCDTRLFTFIENLFQSLVTASRMAQKLRFAVVCSSNMNRSMEAHSFLQKKGYDIKSYGTGQMIKVQLLQKIISNIFKSCIKFLFIQMSTDTW